MWYARQVVEHGWSRAVLIHQIESDLHSRQGAALTNFRRTLPPEHSDLAQQIIKDPYCFDFLRTGTDVTEDRLQKGLLLRLRDFLIELGKGFAFLGSEYHLEIGGQDYFLDLLFYHLNLRRFMAIELKVEAFKPEFAGKMGFYLSALDDLLRRPEDDPSIGLILCKERNRIIVEYALRDSTKPMGVAEYRVASLLPEDLRTELPSAEELAAEMEERKS